MKKLLLISAINFSSMIANSKIAVVDLDKVAAESQMTAGVRRAAEEGQRKLQVAQQKLNEYRAEAEKALMKGYESLQKGESITIEALKVQEIDATTKLEVKTAELKADQNKLQVEIAAKMKSLEGQLKDLTKPFAESKGFDVLIDKKSAYFFKDSLDVTKDFTLFCDKNHLAEVKRGDLVAKNTSVETVDFAKAQKNTVLAQSEAQASQVTTA